ncbi:MAG: transposase [Acidobacteriota bacterium]
MRHDNFIPPQGLRRRSRGRLPHWEVDDADYFVTFRLRDSLPHAIARKLVQERAHLIETCHTAAERSSIDKAFGVRLDSYLDAGYGSCILVQHAEVVANALRYFDGKRYVLHAWCVMPNHVHALFHLEFGRDLDRVLHSWKSYTAHEIDQGVIWQREYFDRVIRGPEDFRETRIYILRNPAKAGLADWKWVSG